MKELKGKALTDFDKWFLRDKEGNNIGLSEKQIIQVNIEKLDLINRLPFSMQSGVLLEWLDSVGIIVVVDFSPAKYLFDVIKEQHVYEWSIANIVTEEYFYLEETHKSRQEALKEAIKKAVEIYNKD